MARKLIKYEETSIPIRTDIANVLPKSHLDMTQDMLNGYYTCLTGGCRQKAKTADRTLAAIQDFIGYCGKAPWLLRESDFEKWGYHLGIERKLAKSSQRISQIAVRGFYNYICDKLDFCNDVRKLFGGEIKQVSFRHNSIIHKNEKENTLPLKSMSVADFNKMLKAIDDAIRDSIHYRTKSTYPLMRDKVLFMLMEDTGLRGAEVLSIDKCDFDSDARFPEFGEYAKVTIIGKGDKQGTVQIENPLLPPLLKYYYDNIRPLLANRKRPNEPAFFLSERGTRLSHASLWVNFVKALGLARLDFVPGKKRLSPHSLRRTSVTVGIESGRSMEANRQKHRHNSANTTQSYGDVKDEFCMKVINKSIKNNIKRYEEAINKT